MKQYKLKATQPPFEVVDGPLSGKKFERGQLYTEIPADLEHRFTVEIKAKTSSDKKLPTPSASTTNEEMKANAIAPSNS